MLEYRFPEAVDSTMMSAYSSCPQKFLYEYILGRSPVGRSVHLLAGGAFARGLEVVRKGYYLHGLTQEAAIEAAFPEFVKAWGDYEAPEKQYKDDINMWAAVVAYFEEYPMESDPFQPIMHAGEPAVEFRFSIPLHVLHPETGNPLMYAGRLDQLSADTPDTCYAQDEKTTNGLGSSWAYQWAMRGQFYGYTYAARQYGYPCQGALIRGIAIQQTQFQFAQQIVFISDDQLHRWWIHTNAKAAEMVQRYMQFDHMMHGPEGKVFAREAHDTHPMSYGDACTAYGGCSFVDLCQLQAPWTVYKDFERRVWNPVAQDPTAGSEDRLTPMGKDTLANMMEGL